MALLDLKFELPTGNIVNVGIEDNYSVETLISEFKKKELLKTFNDYKIKSKSGDTLENDSLFGNVKSDEFTIVDTMDEIEQFPEIGNVKSPRIFHQLGIFVLDGSGSMGSKTKGGITKAQAVNQAIRDLLTRFKASKNVNDFSFAVVTFDNEAKENTGITTATEIDDNENYDPLEGHGGWTDIREGIVIAEKLALDHMKEYEPGGPPHSVAILLMTDGMDHNSKNTLAKVEEIKNGVHGGQISFYTTLLSEINGSEEEAKDHLKAIATDKVMGYKEVYDSATLRNFFIKSLSHASGVQV